MNTNTNTNTTTKTNTSGMSEIRELTDNELDAVNGGSVNSLSMHCASGKHFEEATLVV